MPSSASACGTARAPFASLPTTIVIQGAAGGWQGSRTRRHGQSIDTRQPCDSRRAQLNPAVCMADSLTHYICADGNPPEEGRAPRRARATMWSLRPGASRHRPVRRGPRGDAAALLAGLHQLVMGKFYSREGPTLYTSMPPVSGALVSVQMSLTNEPYRSLEWSADEASSLHLGRVLRRHARAEPRLTSSTTDDANCGIRRRVLCRRRLAVAFICPQGSEHVRVYVTSSVGYTCACVCSPPFNYCPDTQLLTHADTPALHMTLPHVRFPEARVVHAHQSLGFRNVVYSPPWRRSRRRW